MIYFVKEIHLTIQGEGVQAGRAAVFVRFSGCNLWSGREADRADGPGGCARWCDTDFVGVDGPGGGRFESSDDLAMSARSLWPSSSGVQPYVICTGGEPLLQLDCALVDSFRRVGCSVGIETNGTRVPPPGIDWICVSPKANSDLVARHGNELKLVFPQPGVRPEDFERLDFDHFVLQPLDDWNLARNTEAVLTYCRRNPKWRVGLQLHKFLGVR